MVDIMISGWYDACIARGDTTHYSQHELGTEPSLLQTGMLDISTTYLVPFHCPAPQQPTS